MYIKMNNGGVFSTNSYLIADEASKKAVIFDAPNDTTAPLLEDAFRRGFDVIGLWLTHGHIDHIADHAVVTGRFPKARVAIHPLDEAKLKKPMSMFQVPFHTEGRAADDLLADGQELRIGNLVLQVMHTPGHSPGHVVFYFPKEKVLVGGDMIMMGAIGRVDLPDSSERDMFASLGKIAQLPGETRLLPGHGEVSTLGKEARENPYVQQVMRGK